MHNANYTIGPLVWTNGERSGSVACLLIREVHKLKSVKGEMNFLINALVMKSVGFEILLGKLWLVS